MSAPDALITLLSWLYVILFLVVIVQIIRIIYYRHRMYSFQGGFLSICLIWTSLRVIFWFFVEFDTWPLWLCDFLYVLPTVCQCATFSLLILFYIQLTDNKNWYAQRANLTMIYALANLTMLVLTILYAGLANISQNNTRARESERYLDRVYYIISGIYFSVMVGLAIYYVNKLNRVAGPTARLSKRTIIVTSLVFVICFSRAIFDFIIAGGGLSSTNIGDSEANNNNDNGGSNGGSNNNNGGGGGSNSGGGSGNNNHGPNSSGKNVPIFAFVLFLLWEISPTSMVLVYFGKIPSTRVAMFASLRAQIRQCIRRVCPSFYNQHIASDTDSGDEDNFEHNEHLIHEDAISPVVGKRIYRPSLADSSIVDPSHLSHPNNNSLLHHQQQKQSQAHDDDYMSPNSFGRSPFDPVSSSHASNKRFLQQQQQQQQRQQHQRINPKPNGNIFDDPHRYSLTPDDNWHDHSYTVGQHNDHLRHAYTNHYHNQQQQQQQQQQHHHQHQLFQHIPANAQQYYESLSSHYDMTPHQQLGSPRPL